MADLTTRAELLGKGAQVEKGEGGKGRETSARCHTQYAMMTRHDDCWSRHVNHGKLAI